MKKIIKVVLVAAFLLTTASSAFAEKTGVYVTPKFMYSFTSGNGDASDATMLAGIMPVSASTFGGALSVGYETKIGLRAELEYSIASPVKELFAKGNTTDKITNMTQTAFVNVFYDFKNKSNFTPYLGAGLGAGFNTFNTVDSKDPSDTTVDFAWNVGAGVSYKITELLALDLNYRFAQVGNGRIVDPDDKKVYMGTGTLSNHQALLGLRFSF